MPYKHTISSIEHNSINELREVYSSRFRSDHDDELSGRRTPCSDKEILAIIAVAGSIDDAIILMLDRVGQPSWRGATDLCPYYPDLSRNR